MALDLAVGDVDVLEGEGKYIAGVRPFFGLMANGPAAGAAPFRVGPLGIL